MKLSNKIVEDVVEEVAGKDVLPLIKALKNKKNVSEFKLATDVKQEINTTRNMLYRLFDNSLVSFVRRKDKKKGWYIYYWTFNTKMIKYLATDLRRKRLDKMKERLKREEEIEFYHCQDECMRLDFDQATNFEFKCPECGKLLDREDMKEKTKKIENIKKDIKDVEKELKN